MSRRRDRVAVLALDACDPDVAIDLVRAGRMPNLGRVLARSARSTVRQPLRAVRRRRVAELRHRQRPGAPRRALLGDHRPRHLRAAHPPAADRSGARRSGTLAGDADRRVAILDVPHTSSSREVNGVQISEWGCHDRHFGLRSWPPGLADDVARVAGPAPDPRRRRPPGARLRPRRLRPARGAPAEHRRGGRPHSAVCWPASTPRSSCRPPCSPRSRGTCSSRCSASPTPSGHQQWHLHDADPSPLRRRPCRRRGRRPARAGLRRARHRASGKLLLAARRRRHAARAAQPRHGPALRRHPPPRPGPPPDRPRRARRRHGPLPRALAKRAAPALPAGPLDRPRAGGAAVAVLPPPGARPRRRATSSSPRPSAPCSGVLAPNNFVVAGIRLNLVGREPRGCVQPDQVAGLVERLRGDLLRPRQRRHRRARRPRRRAGDPVVPRRPGRPPCPTCS